MAIEPDGSVRRLDDRDDESEFKGAGHEIADVVMRGGEAAIRTTSFVTERMAVGTDRATPSELTVLGWPLVARGEVAGVLVGVDFGRPRRMPALATELVDALGILVEPVAFALTHALRVERAEALSVTDDLTQLYNSRFLNDALRKETKRACAGGWPLSPSIWTDSRRSMMRTATCWGAGRSSSRRRDRGSAREDTSLHVWRRRVRDSPCQKPGWRAPSRSPDACGTASSGRLPVRARPGQPDYRLDWPSDVA
jgi:hypothetical protein